MPLHNEHVVKYWRWHYWLAMQAGRAFAATFYLQWAQDEHDAQAASISPDHAERPSACQGDDCRGGAGGIGD